MRALRLCIVVVGLAAAGCAAAGPDEPGMATVPESDPAAADPPGVVPDPDGLAPAVADSDDTYDPDFLLDNVGNFPSLDEPRLIAASDATWIEPDDVVMGVVGANGEAQAYPVNQMAYHHIANTRLAGEPFLVTY